MSTFSTDSLVRINYNFEFLLMGLVCGCTDKSSKNKDGFSKEGGAMSDHDSMMENHYKQRQIVLHAKDMNLKNNEFRR